MLNYANYRYLEIRVFNKNVILSVKFTNNGKILEQQQSTNT